MNPLLLTDFYKVSHPFQYPKGTEYVFSNLTPRKSRIEGVDSVIFFGLQYFLIHYLEDQFVENFFYRPEDEVVNEYAEVCKASVGDLPSYQHIRDLHRLGYLPIKIRALPEGTRVRIGVPMLTVVNTLPEFYWVTNFIESLMSAVIWQGITSATIADRYKQLFVKSLKKTIGDTSFADFMGHDFSFRGMGGLESAIMSGMAHLTSFKGTDTIPAILGIRKYYMGSQDLGYSVPATEHSVMSAGTTVEGELETYRRLITKTYPSGIISIVSDTYDLWEVIDDYLPSLKSEILARDGKVVIRPDSGDPVKIICGDLESKNERARLGAYRLLDKHFGSTIINGYKVLNPKVGLIYGDSITYERAETITNKLIELGFAPLMVYGIGSYTYQYNTRDTFGMAVKCTAIKHDGKWKEVYKNPVTDDGTKKSARGLLSVKNGVLTDRLSEPVEHDDMSVVYEDGAIYWTSIYAIRDKLA